MMRPSTVLLLLLSVVSSSRRNGVVVGYTLLPIQQRSSNFVGRDVLASPPSSSSSRRGGSGGGANIEMKKGKANLPSHMRSQYKRSQEMEAYRQQMIESQVSGRRWLVDSARKWDACADLLSPPLPSPYRRPVFLSFATRHIFAYIRNYLIAHPPPPPSLPPGLALSPPRPSILLRVRKWARTVCRCSTSTCAARRRTYVMIYMNIYVYIRV